jgi:hypothetical protein
VAREVTIFFRRMRMKTLICSVLLAVVGAAGSAYAQSTAGAEEGRIEMPGANWLFVQTAE